MRVWVDCTAAAHPLVLRPIVERLVADGHEVEVTARAYGQTLGILERLGIPYRAVGRHAGAGTLTKGAAAARRAAALARWARPRRFDLALAHGSVELALVAAALRIPAAQMQDYELAGLQRQLSWRTARRVIVPDAIPLERLRRAGAALRKVFRYPGLKEDYYLADFEPDPAVLVELGLADRGVEANRAGDERVLVVLRPPPETSAYHADNPLYGRLVERIAATPEAIGVVIPRTERQGAEIRARGDRSLLVPDRAVDAQSLIAYADLVVSAGGTMNREAVALGTPVYTIFSGRLGAVDERLIADGRLRVPADAAAIELVKRRHPTGVVEPRDPRILVDAVLAAAG
jgi:predicted glycosyltransferase